MSSLPPEVVSYYNSGVETSRLAQDVGLLERTRTQSILERYLPPPPAVIYDVGGGSGVYACWLARRGYEVHLLDVVPLHVEQAREASSRQPDHSLASVEIGDARRLPRKDDSVDAVLLLGPLYHLTDRQERLAAWREALRVLRPRGVVAAAGISRFAPVMDGLKHGWFEDPQFTRMAERDLKEGQHRNLSGRPEYFTTAYFHYPQELGEEAEEAGLHHEATLGVEGPGWLFQDFAERWAQPDRRDIILGMAHALERESSLLGVSAHLIAIARKL